MLNEEKIQTTSECKMKRKFRKLINISNIMKIATTVPLFCYT